MILRIKREWMMIKGKREDVDRGGRGMGSKRRDGNGIEGKREREIIGRRRSFMEEEKGKRDPRRKRKERMIRKEKE